MPTDSEEIVGLKTSIGHLVSGFNEFRTEIKEWKSDTEQKFVQKQVLEQMFIRRDEEIRQLREDQRDSARKSDIIEIKEVLKEIKEDKRSNKSLTAAWVSAAISAVMAIVAITSLYYSLHK